MKIAVVSSSNIPSDWANGINTAKHAGGFTDLGHEISLLAPLRCREKKKLKEINNINDFYNINRLVKTRFFTDRSPFYFGDIKVISRLLKKINKITGHKIRYFFDPERNIADHIKNNDFDFVYCRAFRTPYYLIKCNIPVVVETHAPTIKNPELEKLLELSSSKYFLGISTISDKIKEGFIKYGFPADKILVQEDAVDIDRFDEVKKSKQELRKDLGLSTNKKIITYCGSLRPGKGIPDLIKLAEAIKDKRDREIIVIGGPTDRKEYFEEERKKKNLVNIRFIGFVENNMVPQYLKASDVLVMLYNKNEGRAIMDYETTSPIKLFEYMGSGTPVIATDIETIAKVVQDKKHVSMVKMGDIEDIVQKIDNVLQDAEFGLSLSNKAYDLACLYTYKKRCVNIIKYFYGS